MMSPGPIVESPSQLTTCRGTLVLASGQTETGTVTSNPGAGTGVSWESDDAAQKRRVAEEATRARAAADIAAHAKKEEPTPIEKREDLFEDSKEWLALIEKLVRLVRSNDFSCESVSGARPMLTATGYVLRCNRFRYSYDIQDKGGHWVVSVR